jgi:monoamine oxidase
VDADVIVIGGGAAGLMAARRLSRARLRVILLEARDRVGGRVADGVIPGSTDRAELGAEFIHGAAPQTMGLLREAGMHTSPISDVGWTFDADVGMRPDERDFGQTAALLTSANSLKHDMSVDDYLRRFERDETTREAAALARTFVEGFDAADPAIASVKGIAEEVGSGVDFNSTRPSEGYAPIFATLHASCIAAGVDVRVDARVRAIAWKRGNVTVECASETLSARAVVITLSVGVL